MMVRDRGDAGLGDDLGHGDTKGYVHRDGEDVLRDEKLEVETLYEVVDARLQLLLHFVDAVGDLAGTRGRLRTVLSAPHTTEG